MKISVAASIDADPDLVWQTWVSPEHIKVWNTASSDWHTTKSEVDLTEGGQFMSRMEAKDGSFGFDFSGQFSKIIKHHLIEYQLDDGRQVRVEFEEIDHGTRLTETFDAEDENTPEVQREGWQSILDNFARYVETLR